MDMWWRDRTVYQIYPMSFMDQNGDGIGDINGIISKLDYLKTLGVGIVWLSPLYKSPNEDNGYDIADYRDINPEYGTMDDMDRLIAEAKKHDIKLIMDLVVNHTSKEHEWFQKSRRRIEPYTDYYIWRDKPNNWTSFFAEDCWEYDDVRRQYYLHLFAKGQPDLNYREPRVKQEVKDLMRFWLEKGISGFRCDVINILWKDTLDNGRKKLILTGSENYITRPGTLDILSEIRREVLADFDCFTVGETVFVTPKAAKELCTDRLDMVFSFAHMGCDQIIVKWFRTKFRPRRLFNTLAKWQELIDWNANYFENHDQPRSVSRFGNDAEYREMSAKALALLLFSLRGTPFIYQGEELGMRNFDFKSMDDIRDVESINVYRLAKKMGIPRSVRWKMIQKVSRDNARTPMHWTGGKNGGFTNGTPWLKVTGDTDEVNAVSEMSREDSVFAFYREIIAFRSGSRVLIDGAFKKLRISGRSFVFERLLGNDRLRVAVDLSGRGDKTGFAGRALVSNFDCDMFDGVLPPYGAVIFEPNGGEA